MKGAEFIVALCAFVHSSFGKVTAGTPYTEMRDRKHLSATDYVSKDNLIYSLLSTNIKIKTSRTVILHVVLRGCETWSLTFREERRLRLFENRVLRRIFGPKKDEVTGDWRKLHNEELNNLYSSPNIIRVIKS